MNKFSLSFGLILVFTFYALFSNSESIPLNLPSNQQSSQTSSISPQTQAKPRGVQISDDFEGEGEGGSGRVPQQNISTQPPSAAAPSTSGTQTGAQPGGMMSGGMGSMMGQYKNGSYTGNAADAYYGYVQVEAVISGGKISDVQFLQHPSDRGTSIEINNYAMPILTQEAIQAQNSNVDIVSGATETSLAFRDSLASALAQAKN
ncbi:MAG TPA: FMN-binding protein [Candidatus Paceibacterota bacterium]|nr:FMN-binding protein [Candidatus Paceibacterota bacterium]